MKKRCLNTSEDTREHLDKKVQVRPEPNRINADTLSDMARLYGNQTMMEYLNQRSNPDQDVTPKSVSVAFSSAILQKYTYEGNEVVTPEQIYPLTPTSDMARLCSNQTMIGCFNQQSEPNQDVTPKSVGGALSSSILQKYRGGGNEVVISEPLYSLTPTIEQKKSPIDHKQFEEEQIPENDIGPIDEKIAKEDENFDWIVSQSEPKESQSVSPKIRGNRCSLRKIYWNASRSSKKLTSKRKAKKSSRNTTRKRSPHKGPKMLTRWQFDNAKQEVTNLLSKKESLVDLYTPLSPIRKSREFNEKIGNYKESNERHYFQIGSSGQKRCIIGSGKFMPGIFSYKQALARVNEGKLVNEMNKLFQGGRSTLKVANNLYALIVGCEGAARSMHNIAVADIFFQSYGVLKEVNPGKNLLKLMQQYLTFVSKGGAKKSKEYEPNKNELQMVIAFCKNQGINTKQLGDIANFLKEMTEKDLRNARINIINCKKFSKKRRGY